MHKINNQLLQKLDQQIYEDLTLLYKYFKQKSMLVSKLLTQNVSTANQNINKQQKVTQLKHILTEQQYIFEKYTESKGYLIFFKMIFYRFFSRLIEIIQKQKKNALIKNQNILKEYYNAIQTIILKAVTNKQSDYIQSLIHINDKIKKLLRISSNRISSKIDKNDKFERKITPYEKKSEKINITNIQIQDKKNSNNMINTYKTMSCICTPRNKIQIDCEPIKKRPKLTQINHNSQFNHLECLDLQFEQYKSIMTHIKNSMKQSNDQLLIRNYLVAKQINNYAKSYTLYKAKQIRKSKLHKSKNHKNSKDSQDFSNWESSEISQNIYSKQLKDANRSFQQTSAYSQKIINLQSDHMLENYSKNSKLYFYSPKKISLCMDNISLMPQIYMEHNKKLQSSSQYRRKVKNIPACPKKSSLNQSSNILVEGKKIQEMQSKRLDNKMENEKVSQSTLFI